MKNLLANIWKGPGSTVASGIILVIGVYTARGESLDPQVELALLGVAAFLSLFSGPGKGKKGLGQYHFYHLILLGFVAIALSSCTVTLGRGGKPVFGADPAGIERALDWVNNRIGGRGDVLEDK